MTIQEINQKRDYLNSLRAFTQEETERIKNDIIQINVKPNCREEEIKGITNVYSYIEYLMKEESLFPYPKGYRHPLTEDLLQDINRVILLPYTCFLPFEKGFYRARKAEIGGNILPTSKYLFLG